MTCAPANAVPVKAVHNSGWLAAAGRGRCCLLVAALCVLSCVTSWAQPSGPHAAVLEDLADLTLSTDSVGPLRFVAAHGQRAVVMGYPQHGLEVWAYPVQILSNYQIGIRAQGAANEVPGQFLLRRIEYRPQDVTRIYVGPNFVVRERLFVPIDQPGAILTYAVEGRQPVDITVHFKPVLDLMWPAAIGGQSTVWHDDPGGDNRGGENLGGYVLTEPLHRYSAAVVSPNTIAHDSTENSAVRPADELAFTIRPTAGNSGNAHALVLIGLAAAPAPAAVAGSGAAGVGAAGVRAGDVGATGVSAIAKVKELAARQAELETQAAAHYAELRAKTIAIETPDAKLNQALAWAEIALDQAWVCNPDLGCAQVGGYGPSRNGRRPQYDWFFAGDGLVGAEAMAAAGDYDRASSELEFILKYQQPKTGMIWHELSQSAGTLDWAGKYPYMYVHVDITFQFLSGAARYVAASGDRAFAREHWTQLEAAYRYCQSVIDPATRLPRIPADKEGGNEQDRMSDDLGLSASWLSAAASFAEMAKATGHAQLAVEAEQASEAARQSIAERYWDERRHFWISGHIDQGRAIDERRSGPSKLIAQHVFSGRQNESLLNALASADFQTDWGTRSVPASAPSYDPSSYARGSTFALHTAGMASAFWSEHRPATAYGIWSTLLPLNWLDSPGHIHEVLAGDVYHQQAESVPEQTWSSAGILDAAVHGLLGLELQPAANRIVFAPHLPPQWQHVTIRHIHLPDATLALTATRIDDGLQLDVVNDGDAVKFLFEPEIPLGARALTAQWNGKPVVVTAEPHSQDQHASVSFTAAHGSTRCLLRYTGGVGIITEQPSPLLGDASRGLKITGVQLSSGLLTVNADVPASGASLELETAWKPEVLEGRNSMRLGANLVQLGSRRYQVALAGGQKTGYVHRTLQIHLNNR